MAASRTPATADPPRRIAVAYSAGRDSTALLHATATAAVGQGVEVLALHVHHGLSPHADDWLLHAQRQCARWVKQGLPVRLCAHRLARRPAVGESVEAWARRERYRALREMALQEGASVVLLAHHQRDQAETFMLQALRGAGVAGLAGMPPVAERDGVRWERPWLQRPRSAIEAYVRQHRLRFVDDDSNDQARFARNRLRLEVWPSLAAAFPQADASLADAATWAAQATEALAELAAIDLAEVADAEGLKLSAWRALSPPRQVNALRAWLLREGGALPGSTLLQRLQAELPGTGDARWEWPQGVLHRHRGRLTHQRAAHTADAEPETSLRILKAGRYPLPRWGGVLVAVRVREGGVHSAWLAQLELRPRTGGEQFMAGIGRPARSLKKQYQAADVPAWERDGPLVYSGGQLVFVPGLGIDARVQALPGQPQLGLRWERG
ncbi:tRNA lysidine(34) synthetase TilS [Piscinibacter sp. HJYY11]|uniref:tRNA lysidine(34) synthetase TilS n=1 Tax=Piscinibacter sp. HJYY11 TaxID=2801333 RepID=UPI00191F7209|nr:tRNA lysidine(34) synthetase TilS [Piscinibacter sp. HJYY11]MBL0726327.1 tRNA lysidine(34) synthetase TilS [Piscinibacter sp. HJYY11]